MKPVPIPQDQVYGEVVRLAPPEGMTPDQVAYCEAVIDEVQEPGALDGAMRAGVRIALDPGDVEALQRNPHLWVFFIGAVNPFLLLTEEELNAPADDEGIES